MLAQPLQFNMHSARAIHLQIDVLLGSAVREYTDADLAGIDADDLLWLGNLCVSIRENEHMYAGLMSNCPANAAALWKVLEPMLAAHAAAHELGHEVRLQRETVVRDELGVRRELSS
jgi:hypothetical protein